MPTNRLTHRPFGDIKPSPSAMSGCQANMPATTIDAILSQLDEIIERARRDQSRVGYFAALYRAVTARVRDDIAAGRFDDGVRMERLDVIFANRYLDALEAYRAQRPTSRCWRVAFDATARWPPLVLQHLLLGMNAHINLDLGIAAAEACPGASLSGIERDFREINRLLAEMIDDVQRRVARISPWMWLLDRVGQRADEKLCGFCLSAARAVAWDAALRLAALPPDRRAAEIERLDGIATVLARPIETPGPLVSGALLAIRAREANDVARVLDALARS